MNDWNEYKLFVTENMKDLKAQNASILDELGKIKTEITILKTKAAIWGAMAGTIVAVVIKKVF